MGPGGRGTQTGKTLENMIKSALIDNGYGVCEQKVIGKSLFGGRYKADLIISEPLTPSHKCNMLSRNKIIISCKWQQVSGTAEQKILYEIASLIKIIKESNGAYKKAYLVFGGGGFSPYAQNFMRHQKHRDILKDADLVEVYDLGEMVAKINKREL